LVKLDLQELADYVAELIDTIEDLEIKLEEEEEKIELQQVGFGDVHKIGFYYEERGITLVKAEKIEDAEAMVMAELEEYGLERIKYETNDRDYGAMKVGE
jgi:hypothetical protein